MLFPHKFSTYQEYEAAKRACATNRPSQYMTGTANVRLCALSNPNWDRTDIITTAYALTDTEEIQAVVNNPCLPKSVAINLASLSNLRLVRPDCAVNFKTED